MKKFISILLALTIAFPSFLQKPLYAQMQNAADSSEALSSRSQVFNPTLIKGIKIYPDNPFKIDFLVSSDEKNTNASKGSIFKNESQKLIKYFLAALTVPENDLWVNLAPNEKNRIIPKKFGETEMGIELLSQDYALKQLTASLMNPEGEIGKAFWQKIYSSAQKKYGALEIPQETLNKIWITPQRAVVYESGNNAYIADTYLKVETLQCNVSTILKELILPEIENEVNYGKTFASLRQIFNSVILARWFKANIKKNFLNNAYSNKNKISGVDVKDKNTNKTIYKEYIEAFKKGAFNYIKEEYDSNSKQIIPRKYFCGGTNLGEVKIDTIGFLPRRNDRAEISIVSAQLKITTDAAQIFKPTSEQWFQLGDTLRELQNTAKEIQSMLSEQSISSNFNYIGILLSEINVSNNKIILPQDEETLILYDNIAKSILIRIQDMEEKWNAFESNFKKIKILNDLIFYEDGLKKAGNNETSLSYDLTDKIRKIFMPILVMPHLKKNTTEKTINRALEFSKSYEMYINMLNDILEPSKIDTTIDRTNFESNGWPEFIYKYFLVPYKKLRYPDAAEKQDKNDPAINAEDTLMKLQKITNLIKKNIQINDEEINKIKELINSPGLTKNTEGNITTPSPAKKEIYVNIEKEIKSSAELIKKQWEFINNNIYAHLTSDKNLVDVNTIKEADNTSYHLVWYDLSAKLNGFYQTIFAMVDQRSSTPYEMARKLNMVQRSIKRYEMYNRLLNDILWPDKVDIFLDRQGFESKGFPEHIYEYFLVPYKKLKYPELVEKETKKIRLKVIKNKTAPHPYAGKFVKYPVLIKGNHKKKHSDKAKGSSQENNLGGVDLTSNSWDIKTNGNSADYYLPESLKYLISTPINGLTPEITNIQPCRNLEKFLQ